MKLRGLIVLVTVIFHAAIVAHGQNQQRTSRLIQTEAGQESARPSRGSRRFSIAATDAGPEKSDLDPKLEDGPIKKSNANYRTVSRFDPEASKTADTSGKNYKLLRNTKKSSSELVTESAPEAVEVAIEPQSRPRPTRQSRGRVFDAARRRERIITDDEIDPIQRKVILDEENVTPSGSLRRRPFSRARLGSDDKKTNLESVSSQNAPVEKKKSGTRTSFASRQADEVANSRSVNDVTPRRSPLRNAAKNINGDGDVVDQPNELPKRTYQPTTRASVRGSTHYKRPNKPKKDDASEVNDDDNYPEEFIKKIKKNSQLNVVRSSQLNDDLADEKRPTKVLKSVIPTKTTESASIESIIEDSSPIPVRRTSSRPLPSARRKTINSRLVNNGVSPTVAPTPTPTPTLASTSRSRGEVFPETQLRSRPSFRPRSSTSSTLSTEEYISSSIPNYSEQSTASDDENSLIQEQDIDSIPNISTSEKSSSRRPSYKSRQAYVPKSRVSSTSVRSNQIVVPIKPGFRARPPQPRFNPDTPRPLQPQISNRLRTFTAVTQEYVGDASPTRPPVSRRFQAPRSRRPSTTKSIRQEDKAYDDEETNSTPRPKPRESGSVKERIKFKPKETSTPFKYASELRRSYQKPSTETGKTDVKSFSQLGGSAPRHRFSSRYRGEGLKSSRTPAGGYVATLPQLATSPSPFTTDFSLNTDLSTETLDIEESTIQDTTDVGPLFNENSSVELDTTSLINNEELAPSRLQNDLTAVTNSAETVTPTTLDVDAIDTTKSQLTEAGTTASTAYTTPSTAPSEVPSTHSDEGSSLSTAAYVDTASTESTSTLTTTSSTTETTQTTENSTTEATSTSTTPASTTTLPSTTNRTTVPTSQTQPPATTIPDKTTLNHPTPTTPTPKTTQKPLPKATPKVTTKKPATLKPTTKKPTTQKPTTKQPTTKQPTTKKPTTKQPTTQKPTTKKPTTQMPTTIKAKPMPQTTQRPTTPMPTTNTPSTTPTLPQQQPITKTPSLVGVTLPTPKQNMSPKQNVSPSDAFINAINTTLIAIRITPTIEGRFAVRVAVAPRGTMSSTTTPSSKISPKPTLPPTPMSFITSQSNDTVNSRSNEITLNNLDSSLPNSIDRMDTFNDTAETYLSPPNQAVQDFNSLSLTLEEYLNNTNKNEIEKSETTTQLPKTTSTPLTPYPFVIYGIFPNNTVFRKYPNTGVTEIVDEREIARRDPYFPPPSTETAARSTPTMPQKTIDDQGQAVNRLDSSNSSSIDSTNITTRIGSAAPNSEETSVIPPETTMNVKEVGTSLSTVGSPENTTTPVALHNQTSPTTLTHTTELTQTIETENNNTDTDSVNSIKTIMAKPEVSNAVYTGKDSKYNNFWSGSTSTTEKVKFRFLTVNLSPGTSVQTPTQEDPPSETSTTSTTVFRWKPVTDAVNDTGSLEATTPTNLETPITLANLIYKSKEAASSESDLSSNLNSAIDAQKEMTILTRILSDTPQSEDTTTESTTTTTTTPKPTSTSTTTTQKPSTTTTQKPTTTTKKATTTKKPTTTTKKPSTTTTTTTTKKPTTTTTKKPTTTTTTKKPTTTTTKPTTTTTKQPSTTTTKKSTTVSTTSTIATTSTKKPTTTTTKKPTTTTKKSTTTSNRPVTTQTSKKPAPTTVSTPALTTTKPTAQENGFTTSRGNVPENKPSDERYIDDILLLNTLLQGGGGQSVSPRTGRTQNAQLVLANQIIELALMRAAASTPKPKISTTTENYRDFLQALVSSSQASFLEKAKGPSQKELENFVENYKDEETGEVISTPDNLPKIATTTPAKSTTTNQGPPSEDDILAALLDPQLAGTKSPKKAKPAKKPTTTPAPSGLRYLLQAFSGARNNQPSPVGGLLRPQSTATGKPQDDSPDSTEGGVEGGIPSSTDPGLLNAAINVTRAVSQFMGYVIQGAAESFQNYVRSRTGGFLTNYFNLGVASPS